MLVADVLNPPIQYALIWLIIGLCLLVIIPVWYGVLFWITRHKAIMTLETLKTLPTGAELDRLKAKYLKLIEQAYGRYQKHEISLRKLHQDLSLLTRYFVFEAKHFPAPTLTLADFKRAPYPTLTALIAGYYPKEFAAIEHGDAAISTEAAKGFVVKWN